MEKINEILVDIENEIEIKKQLRSQLKDITQNISKSIFPQKIFFSRWALASPEGRQSFFFLEKQLRNKKNKELKEDFETKNKAKIWLYTFPDHREDYLIERIWQFIVRFQMEGLRVDIKFTQESRSSFSYENENNCWKIKLPKGFLKCFNGQKIIKKIINGNRSINVKKEEADLVKRARQLRYDIMLNEIQLNGIRTGYKMWMEKSNLKKTLTKIFKQLYNCREAPLMKPEESLSFLFMWQNFSIVFPGFSDVSLYFFVDTNNPSVRSCLGFFWKNSKKSKRDFANEAADIPKRIEKAITTQIGNAVRKKINDANVNKNSKITDSKNDLWGPIKEKFNYLWNKTIPPEYSDSIDPLMELSGKLAFSQHEGKPCKFAFISGTEQVWPVVAEIVGIDFYSKKELINSELANMKFDPDLYTQICEANYSIFQVSRVVGFFNVKTQTLNKIIRLRDPSEEEIQLREDPVVDQDDFFCWAIERIFKVSSGKTCIVSTEGDGKVRVYSHSDQESGELLLLWDIGKGKLRPPLGENDQEDIVNVIKTQLGINNNNDLRIKKIIKTIRKISANVGEGAALILAKDDNATKAYLTSMELLKPSWLRTLSLDDPHYILHAAFIMDGACLITKSKIEPRQAIYPHTKNGAWGLQNIINHNGFKRNKEKIIKKLSGKGSKTHASANLSTVVNRNPQSPQVVVISISADGPIKIWPQELLK